MTHYVQVLLTSSLSFFILFIDLDFCAHNDVPELAADAETYLAILVVMLHMVLFYISKVGDVTTAVMGPIMDFIIELVSNHKAKKNEMTDSHR